MTPAARHAAAIDILDRVLDGTPAEAALTGWARASRFAGSKDRAAVRDIVFDALRKRRSAAAMGGALTGRGIVLGLLRVSGTDPDSVFTGQGHAPAPLTPAERMAGHPPTGAAALDIPDWMTPLFRETLGDQTDAALLRMRDRATVWLRVNSARGTTATAQVELARDGIETIPDQDIKTALQVSGNTRGIKNSAAYISGLVELQDLSSQRLAQALSVPPGGRVLDYCAGGGGKALALAALGAQVTAHDAFPDRMADLPVRADRAGVSIPTRNRAELSQEVPFDVILVDAPCSGSGTWARSPDAKWRLTPGRLDELTALQAQIVAEALPLVRPGGVFAYATCSLFAAENTHQTGAMLADHPGLSLMAEEQLTPLGGGDGFYFAIFRWQDRKDTTQG